MRSDIERSLLILMDHVSNNLPGVELELMMSPEGDHEANAVAVVGVRDIQNTDTNLEESPPHAANCSSRYRLMDDGWTLHQRRCGKTWKRPVKEFGESVHFGPVGDQLAMRKGITRGLAQQSYCRQIE